MIFLRAEFGISGHLICSLVPDDYCGSRCPRSISHCRTILYYGLQEGFRLVEYGVELGLSAVRSGVVRQWYWLCINIDWLCVDVLEIHHCLKLVLSQPEFLDEIGYLTDNNRSPMYNPTCMYAICVCNHVFQVSSCMFFTL